MEKSFQTFVRSQGTKMYNGLTDFTNLAKRRILWKRTLRWPFLGEKSSRKINAGVPCHPKGSQVRWIFHVDAFGQRSWILLMDLDIWMQSDTKWYKTTTQTQKKFFCWMSCQMSILNLRNLPEKKMWFHLFSIKKPGLFFLRFRFYDPHEICCCNLYHNTTRVAVFQKIMAKTNCRNDRRILGASLNETHFGSKLVAKTKILLSNGLGGAKTSGNAFHPKTLNYQQPQPTPTTSTTPTNPPFASKTTHHYSNENP